MGVHCAETLKAGSDGAFKMCRHPTLQRLVPRAATDRSASRAAFQHGDCEQLLFRVVQAINKARHAMEEETCNGDEHLVCWR